MLDLIFREYDIRGLYPDELNEKSVGYEKCRQEKTN